MANEKFLNYTGLDYYHSRVKTIFAGKDEVPTEAEIKDLADGQIAASIASSATTSAASKQYVADNGGKIDTIKVNGTAQTITNKAVDITVPTKVSDLNNDSGFQTASDVSTAISSAISGAYKYKGSVATVADLPASGNTTGDVYDVQATGMNYAWNGSSWDELGQLIDTSTLWAKTELTAITTAEIDTITA